MNRSALGLFLVLASCHRGPDAVQARIQLDPGLYATCVALEVLSNDGTVLDTQWVERAQEQSELRVAVFQGSLPDDIQLQARAFWGSGCEGTLAFNGQSERIATRFAQTRIESITMTLPPPSAVEDADGDGFIAHDRGGPDCDDARADLNPHAQEACDGSADLNCDGRRGCDDATCANQTCTWVPTRLAFTTEPAPASVGECMGPVTVQLFDSRGQPAMPGTATRVQLSSLSPGGVSFYAEAGCTSALGAPAMAAGDSQLTFYMKGNMAGSGTLNASALGLFATSPLTVR